MVSVRGKSKRNSSVAHYSSRASSVLVVLALAGIMLMFTKHRRPVDYKIDASVLAFLGDGTDASQGFGIGTPLEEDGLEAEPMTWVANKPKLIPIVHFFHADGQMLSRSHFLWKTIRLTLSHLNKVYLLTNAKVKVPADISNRIEIAKFNATNLQSSKLRRFRKVYKAWGAREPWDRRHVEKWFVLDEFMRQRDLKRVFFADGDLALLTTVNEDSIGSDCDLLVDTNMDKGKRMEFNTFRWEVWAGNSILSWTVLEDFTDFVLKLYDDANIEPLKKRKAKLGAVSAKNLWYLYAVASDPRLRSRWQYDPHRLSLPRARQWRFCDSVQNGFDNTHAYEDPKFHFDFSTKVARLGEKVIKSIHFKGKSGQKLLKGKQFPKTFGTFNAPQKPVP